MEVLARRKRSAGTLGLLGRALALPAFVASTAPAAVSVPGLFSDKMVLQRDREDPVWGTASAGEEVTVRLGTRQATAKAGADGRWMARLPAQPAGGPFELSITGTNSLVFRDVYVGEVWIASGQSNNIHPPNKQDVGLRMSLVALALAYSQPVVAYGPHFVRAVPEGNALRLFFKNGDGGLLLRGGNATTFEVAGANGTWVAATAKVDADSTLLVSAPSVTTPLKARYGWAAMPQLSLFNKAAPNLPGTPFRTDAPAFEEVPVTVAQSAAPKVRRQRPHYGDGIRVLFERGSRNALGRKADPGYPLLEP